MAFFLEAQHPCEDFLLNSSGICRILQSKDMLLSLTQCTKKFQDRCSARVDNQHATFWCELMPLYCEPVHSIFPKISPRSAWLECSPWPAAISTSLAKEQLTLRLRGRIFRHIGLLEATFRSHWDLMMGDVIIFLANRPTWISSNLAVTAPEGYLACRPGQCQNLVIWIFKFAIKLPTCDHW